MALTPAEQEEYEERAAIMEFDGKLPRAKAEAEAMRLILAKLGQDVGKARLRQATPSR